MAVDQSRMYTLSPYNTYLIAFFYLFSSDSDFHRNIQYIASASWTAGNAMEDAKDASTSAKQGRVCVCVCIRRE